MIDPGLPLAMLDSPMAQAYTAQDRQGSGGSYVAFLSDPRMMPRIEAMDSLRGFSASALLRLIDFGPCDWLPTQRRMIVAIYERPAGERVVHNLEERFDPVPDEVLAKGLVAPLAAALRDIMGRGLTHRAIRPNNLFWVDGAKNALVLGEGVTGPPGLDQPAWCEPIESAVCDPSGRGRGSIADDLFALGATVIALSIGERPGKAMTSAELLQRRIDQGSLVALLAGHRLSMNILELVRGLVADDQRERWTFQDIDMWLQGMRLTPRQGRGPRRAARQFTHRNLLHASGRSLANALAEDWPLAAPVVQSPDLRNWVERSLADTQTTGRFHQAMGPTIAASTTEADRLVARVLLALDPRAPIRHRGVAAFPDGLGDAMALAPEGSERRSVLADILAARLPIHWLAMQGTTRPEWTRLHGLFERLAGMMTQTGPGFGYERALYELNPYMPCLSPPVAERGVIDLADLLPALEAATAAGHQIAEPMDRHLAAFIAARSKTVSDATLKPLADDADPFVRLLAGAHMLASVQDVSQSGPLPHLSERIAAILRPQVVRFHNRRQRRNLGEMLDRAAKAGWLRAVVQPFEDIRARDRDERDFRMAARSHAQLTADLSALRLAIEQAYARAVDIGEQTAAVISGVICSIVVSTTLIIMSMY
ncbi:MAG: protein kinase family protein [Thalassobaculales bacterium]